MVWHYIYIDKWVWNHFLILNTIVQERIATGMQKIMTIILRLSTRQSQKTRLVRLQGPLTLFTKNISRKVRQRLQSRSRASKSVLKGHRLKTWRRGMMSFRNFSSKNRKRSMKSRTRPRIMSIKSNYMKAGLLNFNLLLMSISTQGHLSAMKNRLKLWWAITNSSWSS